jgi:hypothetical protein
MKAATATRLKATSQAMPETKKLDLVGIEMGYGSRTA